jgi:acetoin utilization deacetylase AcuC-like enzyme
MPPGTGEAEYMRVFKGQLADQVNMFMPEFVLMSAGFDSHKDDPLGDMNLESASYYRLTREVVTFADMYCDGHIVSTLEGGYALDALAESAAYHVDALLEAGKK